ncbi:MAG: NAD-dependent epimerase/dehydratase family protein [Nitrospinae bacterium]|nr:NAD-dependent epimerase/dehydratase family protein [Nitrospinota bacterium]
MNILVTGGGGFLGRYVVERLIARGDTVVSLTRQPHPELASLGARAVQGDVTDSAVVNEAARGVDGVIHTAARVGVWGPWREFFETNVTGTRNVVAACRANGVSRLVYVSSPSVIFDGRAHEGINESIPYPARYLAHYPQTKAIAEREVLQANGHDNVFTCALRPHLIWGPRDTNLIPRLIARAKSGRLMRVGNGANLVDMVYVENAADACLNALDRLVPGSPVSGAAYFITNGAPVKLWEWVDDILARLDLPKVTRAVSASAAYRIGAAFEIAWRLLGIRGEPPMTRFLALQLSSSHWFDISRARRELGYSPAVGYEEGMRRLVDSLRPTGD